MPLVTVIIPNYNHARFLEKRMSSVLQQTFQDFEIVLLDDCSTDESKVIVENFRSNPRVSHIIFNEKNSGSTYQQWKKGFELAQGKYLWIAESDDFADESFLEIMVDILEKNPNCGLAYSSSAIVDENEKPSFYLGSAIVPDPLEDSRYSGNFLNTGYQECFDYLYKFNYLYNASSVLFRKNALQQVGFEQFEMKLNGDWLLWVKLLSVSDIYFYGEKQLNFFRVQNQSVRNKFGNTFTSLEEYIHVQQFILQNFTMNDCFKNRLFDVCLYKYLNNYFLKTRIKNNEHKFVLNHLKRLHKPLYPILIKSFIRSIFSKK
jgi:glycosyltransferase involved in cell wall biosynthesis